MLKQEHIDFIKQNHRFRSGLNEYLNYVVFIAPIAFGVLALSIMFYGVTTSEKVVGVILFLLAIALAIFINNRLKQNVTFEAIATSGKIDIDVLADTLRQRFSVSNMEIDRFNEVILVETELSFFSWGEELTIIQTSDSILINSHPKTSQPITIIRDRDNIKNLRLSISEIQ